MKIQYSQSYYEDTGKNTILDAIAKTRFALESAYAGFDNATDPDLIDCYIYEVNSLLKRYRFLYHQAQELHLFPAGEPIPMPESITVPLIPVMQDGIFT
ncbi:MAG: YaaL family protein [Lachnospiraceae bacterium]|nr:YaaL family protein [Lachnospiraceae bacterium]MBD5481891.1 YaaL family protein [Lachnospiraceae bacterium]